MATLVLKEIFPFPSNLSSLGKRKEKPGIPFDAMPLSLKNLLLRGIIYQLEPDVP